MSSQISIHALLAESDIGHAVNLHPETRFLSTLSLRRATLRVVDGSKSSIISIHALLAESDGTKRKALAGALPFLSTLSLRRATARFRRFAVDSPHFYPRSPCGERLTSVVSSAGTTGFLSTLSLRRATTVMDDIVFMPRKFLSTLSLRRATISARRGASDSIDFYPRSPCGERQTVSAEVSGSNISIHALLAESDPGNVNSVLPGFEFLSTLSLRRATKPTTGRDNKHNIFLSTLSLRRATVSGGGLLSFLSNFYPRSPCGERRVHYDNYNLHCVISIHALLAESDKMHALKLANSMLFLSTLSLRRATIFPPVDTSSVKISIHALLAESDSKKMELNRTTSNFYPRSPCGERPTR